MGLRDDRTSSAGIPDLRRCACVQEVEGLKTKKKRKGTGLIVAVVILAALIGAYFLVGYQQKKQSEKKTEVSDAEKSATQAALPFSAAEDGIQSFSVVNANGTFTFVKDGDNWTLQEDPSFTLDQDTVTEKVKTIADLSVTRKLEDPDKLSAYGLDQPQVTVTVTKTDGGSYQILFGSENSQSSSYYMMYGGKEDTVYTVYSETEGDFSFQKDDLAKQKDTDTAATSSAE
jgi:hypothetical protein